jgi:oligopeptide transport system permease protein
VTKFIVRRLFWTIPVILLVIFMTFVMMRNIQGNPFRTSERAIPAEIQANLDRKYGLNDPWYVQYVNYVKGVVTFDLGPSLVLRNRDVNDIVATHFPKSLELGGLAFLFAALIGIPLGALSALRANTYVDYTAMIVSNIGFAVPSFLVATLLIYFFALNPWSRSGSHRPPTSRASCAGRCSRRSSRTTSAPPRRRVCAGVASWGCTCCGTR